MENKSGKNTPEYQTLTENVTNVTNIFKGDLLPISQALTEDGFISSTVLDEMSDVQCSTPTVSKAAKLRGLVADRVEMNTENFYKLCTLLASKGQKELSDMLREHCIKLKGKQTEESSSGGSVVPIQGAVTASLDFPRTGFSQHDKETMKDLVEEEMRDHFFDVKQKLISTLEQLKVKVSDIAKYLADMRYVPQDVSCIEQLISTLPRLSFENYSIIEKLNSRYLAERGCSIKTVIENYKVEFHGYIVTKKIIESTFFRQPNIDSETSEDPKCKSDEVCRQLKMKLNIGRRVTQLSLDFVQNLWEVLSDEFELLSITAQINFITKGCLEITWIIVPEEAHKISSTAEAHIEFFESLNAILVVVDGEVKYKRPDSAIRIDSGPLAILEKEKGDEHLKNEKYEQALKCYKKAMVLDPFSAVMAASRAEALVQMQLYADAEVYCGLSICLDDKYAEAYFIRAHAKASLDKIEDALKDLKVTLKLDPNNMQAVLQSQRLESEIKRKEKLAEQEKGEGVPQESTDVPPSSTSISCTGDVCPLPQRIPEVAKNLDQLSGEFTDLVELVKTKLGATEENLAVLQKQLSKSIERLSKEDESFLKITQAAMNAPTVNDFINNLTAQSYWSYMCPEPLSELVKDIEEVQSYVLDYEKKLTSFKEKSKLRSLARCSFPVPEYCVELRLKVSDRWSEMTVSEAEKSLKILFKRGVAGYNPIWRLKKLEQECILVYALLHEGTARQLVKRDRLRELCQKEGVVGFTLNEEVLVDLSEGQETLSTCKKSLRSLLGENVLTTGTLSEVPVSSFESEGSVVGLFFSGDWCPASWSFTPELIEWYNNFKSGPKGSLLNIVFVSSDEDEISFRHYISKMPWYTMDYKDQDKTNEVYTKFKVTGIPSLVFVDGITGQLINRDGRSVVEYDPTGEGFPWKQAQFSDIIANARFTDKDGKKTAWDDLKGKVTGFFFSASTGYRTGRDFTTMSQLIALYNKLKDDKKFEIVDINLDEDEENWQNYVQFIPWISLPYSDVMRRKSIVKTLDPQTLPALIIMDERQVIITKDGLSYMRNDPVGNDFPWYVNSLTKHAYRSVNETTSLVWFVPSDSVDRAKAVLKPWALEYFSKNGDKGAEVDLLFFVAKGGDDVAEALRKFAKLPTMAPLLTIIDVMKRKVYTSDQSEITEDNIGKFITDYSSAREKITVKNF